MAEELLVRRLLDEIDDIRNKAAILIERSAQLGEVREQIGRMYALLEKYDEKHTRALADISRRVTDLEMEQPQIREFTAGVKRLLWVLMAAVVLTLAGLVMTSAGMPSLAPWISAPRSVPH